MAKRLSSKNKDQILIKFQNGENLEELAEQFGCTKLTIVRNLKQDIGEKLYKELSEKNKSLNQIEIKQKNNPDRYLK